MASSSHKQAFADTTIYCRKERNSWHSKLTENGFEGLFALNDAIFQGEHDSAMDREWWHNNPEVKFYELSSHLPQGSKAGTYSLVGELSSSFLNDVMREVTEFIVSENRNEQLKYECPQLFVPSKGGFCPKYLKDDEDYIKYRCFLYLGGKSFADDFKEMKPPPSREHAYISSARTGWKKFGEKNSDDYEGNIWRGRCKV